ncbi:Vps75p TDEL_0D02270 [Torulaspora delbrueckii]|uniref:Uncharacterized protein n=1 Tax=Torulaspora delbrueckii TaxID=4950 RepID=G8ZT67_TORDE|nr:hypothetical protein TDEL_0D02270 [Torulaspora delbrueckii]CCE91811.1 hypothetical protein TDEL_0D02270 [Torulaspora delbrueckii]
MSEKAIASALNELADCEVDVEKAEEDIELYRIRRLKPIYAKRDAIISRIPSFWSIVLSQHSDFADYIRASDFKYVDAIESVIVDWKTPQDFEIEIKIKAIESEFEVQVVKKHFIMKGETLTSQAVEIGISGTLEKRALSIGSAGQAILMQRNLLTVASLPISLARISIRTASNTIQKLNEMSKMKRAAIAIVKGNSFNSN